MVRQSVNYGMFSVTQAQMRDSQTNFLFKNDILSWNHLLPKYILYLLHSLCRLRFCAINPFKCSQSIIITPGAWSSPF